LCESLYLCEIEIRISESAGISLGAGMNADRAHEGTEAEFSFIAVFRYGEFAQRLIEAEPCLLEEWDDAGAKKIEIGCKVEEVDLYTVTTRLLQF
jgi:hypothetical protein